MNKLLTHLRPLAGPWLQRVHTRDGVRLGEDVLVAEVPAGDVQLHSGARARGRGRRVRGHN